MAEISIPNLDIEAQTSFNKTVDIEEIPSKKELQSYLEEQAENSTVLQEVMDAIKAGKIEGKDGQVIEFEKDIAIDLDQAAALFYLIHKSDATLTSEIGFEYGVSSSLFMVAHELNNKDAGHFPIREKAQDVNNGFGANIFDKFGFQNFQIMEHEPWMVLPQIIVQDIAPDLKVVFFNAKSDYDDAFVEFYLIDKILIDHGIVIFNTKRNKEYEKLLKYIKGAHDSYVIKELKCGLSVLQKQPAA